MKKTNKIEFRYYETDGVVIALTGKRWEIPYGTDSMHFHNYLEIGLCRYGEGTMYLGKNEIPYCDGTITIIPKDFVHRTGGKDNEIQKWEYLFVDSEKFINKIYANNLHYASVLLKRLHSRMLVLNSEEYPRLTTIFNLILEKMVEKSEFYQD